MISKLIPKQFILFLMTGGTAAVVNLCSRIFYNQWMSFSSSVILAYITGMFVAFILARIFVFKDSKKPVHHSAAIFVLVNLVAVVQTWGISMALAYHILPGLGVTSYVPEISHVAGVVAPVFSSYYGHKHWSFK